MMKNFIRSIKLFPAHHRDGAAAYSSCKIGRILLYVVLMHWFFKHLQNNFQKALTKKRDLLE